MKAKNSIKADSDSQSQNQEIIHQKIICIYIELKVMKTPLSTVKNREIMSWSTRWNNSASYDHKHFNVDVEEPCFY